MQIILNPESKDLWFVNVLAPDLMSPYFQIMDNTYEYKTYEEALEVGLQEALKNI